jgi:Zn-dependent protease with chaperone function
MSSAAPHATPEPWPLRRVDPFLLPSVTTGRFLLLITAVVGVSLFAYNFVYLAFVQGKTTTEVRDAAWWMIGGVIVLLVGTAGIYLAMPGWIIRRRRLARLIVDDSPELSEEVTRLASEAGVPRPPVVLVDVFNTSASALVFGRPRRRYMLLNGGLVTQFSTDIAAFRATVRHELAHLRNRDVDQTYLAIAVWYSFLLTALAPLAVTMLLEPGWYLVGMSWRLLVLAVIVLLFRNAILRRREYGADARALQLDGPHGALRRVLAGSAASRSRAATPRSRWWPFRTHPPTAMREAALDNPKALFKLGFWDALGAGLVATIAFGNATMLINALLAEPAPLTIRWTAGLFFAPLAAVGITAGSWRTVLFAQNTGGQPVGTLAVGVGLGCGMLLGEPLSLSASITGFWGVGPAPSPLLVTVAVLALVMATVLFAAWIRSSALAWLPTVSGRALRVVVIAAIVASAVVLTVVLGYWRMLHDLHPLIPILTEQAVTNYAMLSASAWPGPQWLWMALNHELILHIVRQDPIVVTVVVLWLFPVAGLLWRRSPSVAGRSSEIPKRSRRPTLIVLIGLAGGAAYAAALLLCRALVHTSMTTNDWVASADFLQVFAHWQIAGAVAAQAAVALGVALWVGSFRVIWGLFAAFITGTVATAAMLGAIVVGGCFDAFSVLPAPCAWSSDGDHVIFMLRWVLVMGALAAIAAGLLGAAMAAIVPHGSRDQRAFGTPGSSGSGQEARHFQFNSSDSQAADVKDPKMKSIQKATALAATLVIFTGLAACSGPGVAAPTAPSSPLVGTSPSTLTTLETAGATQETCDLFRQMVEGIETLSSDEQEQLMIKMTDAVQSSGNPDLMRAVVDMGRGWLDSNPEQFAKGMRAVSKICNVPYE